MNLPQPWLDRLERTLLLILAGFLFWGNAVSSITLMLLVVFVLIQKKTSALRITRDQLNLLAPVGLIILLWGRGGFAATGANEVQLWLTWVAVLIYFPHCDQRIWFKNSFIVLSAVQAFVVITFLYGTSGATIGELGSSQFVRDLVGERFGVHPTYMSAIWFWAALIAVRSKTNKLINGIAAIMLIVGGITTGGKMPLLAFLIVLPVFIMMRSKAKDYRKLIGFVGLGFVIAMVLSGPIMLQRFQELDNMNTNYSDDHWLNATELRVGVWECSWESIISHLWTGVGIGNTRQVLDACYEGYGNDQFFETEFNTHNQFSHYLLAGGVILGSLFLLWWLWMMIRLFYREPKSIAPWFMLYMTVLLLTENYLLRQHGMMFFSFLLMVHFPIERGATSAPSPSAN